MRASDTRSAPRAVRGTAGAPGPSQGRPRAARLASIALALLLAAAQAAASDRPTNDDLRFQRKLEEADRDLRIGNPERALRSFQELLAKRPESREAFIGAVRSSLLLHKLDGIVESVEERAAASPADAELALLVGDALAAAGKREEAVLAWRAALPLFAEPAGGYREAARRMDEARMFPEAIRLLLEGRAALGDSFLFADLLCKLHSLAGDEDASSLEWIRAAAAGTRKSEEALREVREKRRSGATRTYPLDEVRALLDSIPSAHGVREILAELYTDEGRCTEALREYVVLDKTLPSCGRFLLLFAKSALQKGCTEEAAAAARETIGKCEDASTRIEASFLLARVQRAGGDPEGAAETYRMIVSGTRNPKEREAAELELAGLLADEGGEPERAIPILEEAIRRGSLGDQETDIRFRLARARLLAGDAEGAAAAYEELRANAPNDAVRERAIYEKGTALFYAGRHDESLAELRRVVDQYPMGRYLNDALSRSIFISENRDAGDAALTEYAACDLLAERKRYSEARGRFEAMLGTLVLAGLRDDLMWSLARIDEGEGRYRPAIERLEELIAEFPEGRLAQQARLRIADLTCDKIGDLASGIALYEKFLVDFPESVLIEEARRKIREAEKRRGL